MDSQQPRAALMERYAKMIGTVLDRNRDPERTRRSLPPEARAAHAAEVRALHDELARSQARSKEAALERGLSK